MKPADILRFLFGHRGAIERIATSRSSLGIGLLLVLTAGIARNYDHLDLRREFEWFLGPILVSLFSAFFIFFFVRRRLSLSKEVPPYRQFGPFLALFWMTAPIAWLYGIPVESFTDIITATKYNIALLGIVSLWRVLLMAHAVAHLTGSPRWACLITILCPASFEMWIGSLHKGMSLVSIMGGVRLPPHEQIIQDVTSTVATLSFFLFLILVVMLLTTPRKRWAATKELGFKGNQAQPSTWFAALLCLGAWGLASLSHQPLIRNQRTLESLIRDERYREAIDFTSATGLEGFSKIHELPPGAARYGLYRLKDLIPALQDTDPAWLRKIWVEQAMEAIATQTSFGRENPYEMLFLHDDNLRIFLKHEEMIRNGIKDSRYAEKWVEEQLDLLDQNLRRARSHLGAEEPIDES
ncbi:MAG: hypothetical protein AAGB14_15010 [Verrucomicrobiota bacterium]